MYRFIYPDDKGITCSYAIENVKDDAEALNVARKLNSEYTSDIPRIIVVQQTDGVFNTLRFVGEVSSTACEAEPEPLPEGTQVVNETSRTYQYPDGRERHYYGVETVRVSDSGNHYLKYKSEYTNEVRLAIVTPGWDAIEILPGEKQGWTF